MGKGLKDAFLQRRPTHDQQVYENVLSFSACVLSCFSCVQPFVTHWTLVRQAPLSMGFSRQEYWSGLPFPTPGDLPYPGMEPCLLRLQHWQSGSLPLAPSGKPMASVMQWIWTWANCFRRQWGTGRPSVLQPMGSQRVRHDWATEQRQHFSGVHPHPAFLTALC